MGPATAKRLASRGLETVDDLLRAATGDFPMRDARKAVRPCTLLAAHTHTAHRTPHAPGMRPRPRSLSAPDAPLAHTSQVRAYCKRYLPGTVNPVNLAKLAAACERAELAARSDGASP